MSGEKTEKATPRRRKEARDKGQVVKSVEVNGAIILLFTYLGLQLFGLMMSNDLKLLFTDFISNQYLSQPGEEIGNFQNTYMLILKHFFTVCGPLFGIAFITALVVNYLQVGFMFAPKLLGMKFDKINPLAGMKRMFSTRSVVELVKSILKMIIVGTVVYMEFTSKFKQIPNLAYIDLTQSFMIVWSSVMGILWKAGLTLLIFGIFDYAYQKWEFEKNIKMSKEEIKQEYKLLEGDPKVKAKIREVQRHMGMRRMMQRIPEADVVITNPTHFAIVLKYDDKKNKAPIVIAKGQDFIALKIKEEAKKYKIHIVENKPLARTLFKTTDIDEAIPEDLYQAVAEILAVVYKMRR